MKNSVVAAVAVIVIAIAVICVLRGRQGPALPPGFKPGNYSASPFSKLSDRVGPAFGGPGGSGGGDKGGDLREGSGGSGGIPGLPKWLNLDVVVPVTATVIVVCVGILVVCVAVTRRKQPQMTPGLVAKKGETLAVIAGLWPGFFFSAR